MFGSLTRVVALGAVLTHLWVSMIVAPWHHLVEHRLGSGDSQAIAGAAPQRNTTEQNRHRTCRCRHHGPRNAPARQAECPVPESTTNSTDSPTIPDHHDDCSICQILAQAFTKIELPALVLVPERIEFSPPASAVQPWLGLLLDPVSRGPPAA